jgi:hypothetical protein
VNDLAGAYAQSERAEPWIDAADPGAALFGLIEPMIEGSAAEAVRTRFRRAALQIICNPRALPLFQWQVTPRHFMLVRP